MQDTELREILLKEKVIARGYNSTIKGDALRNVDYLGIKIRDLENKLDTLLDYLDLKIDSKESRKLHWRIDKK